MEFPFDGKVQVRRHTLVLVPSKIRRMAEPCGILVKFVLISTIPRYYSTSIPIDKQIFCTLHTPGGTKNAIHGNKK